MRTGADATERSQFLERWQLVRGHNEALGHGRTMRARIRDIEAFGRIQPDNGSLPMNKHSFRLLFMVACAMLLSGAPGAVALAEPASPAPAAVASTSAAIPEDALLQPEDLAQ